MRFENGLLALLLAFGLAACGDDGGTGGVTGDDDDDVVGGTCEALVPQDGFGALVGDYVREFTLPRCDGASTPFSFYGDSYCSEGADGAAFETKVTFLAMAAGWCGPCRAETQAIRDVLYDEFADRGVRFIQVVIEDSDFNPADMDYCENGWLGDFGDVPQITLVDTPRVNFRQNILPPPQGLPFSIIVGQDGEIVAAKSGFSVQGLRDDLEAALALYE